MRTAVLKPAHPDLLVRDPLTREPLPREGAEKPLTRDWLRLLRDGDVVEVEPEPAPEPEPKKKG